MAQDRLRLLVGGAVAWLLRPSAVGALLALLAVPALGCGFHDASGVGTLAAAYPRALWVRTAVWQAQLAGELPPPESLPRTGGGSAGLLDAAGLMQGVASRLGAHGREWPAFSLVLLGPMLWSRFDGVAEPRGFQFHAPGPSAGDIVLVTDHPVVRAIAAGTLSWRAAYERGLLRVYGNPSSAEAVLYALDARDRVEEN